MTADLSRVEAVLESWGPEHDVAGCKRITCPDCAVEACRSDLRVALAEAGLLADSGEVEQDERPLAHLMAGRHINACGERFTVANDTGNLWRVNCEACLTVVSGVRQWLSTRVSIDVPQMASRVLIEPSRVEAVLLALERAGIADQRDGRWIKAGREADRG